MSTCTYGHVYEPADLLTLRLSWVRRTTGYRGLTQSEADDACTLWTGRDRILRSPERRRHAISGTHGRRIGRLSRPGKPRVSTYAYTAFMYDKSVH
jgi:hypothetical protein